MFPSVSGFVYGSFVTWHSFKRSDLQSISVLQASFIDDYAYICLLPFSIRPIDDCLVFVYFVERHVTPNRNKSKVTQVPFPKTYQIPCRCISRNYTSSSRIRIEFSLIVSRLSALPWSKQVFRCIYILPTSQSILTSPIRSIIPIEIL